MAECDPHGTIGKDKDRFDIEEDVVLAAGKDGNNNNNNYGGEMGNMDNVVGMVAVMYVSKEENGGNLIAVAPEGRTTIVGLTMKRTCWWMLTSRRMWWRMRPTLCL
jgi:hypothetical protein